MKARIEYLYNGEFPFKCVSTNGEVFKIEKGNIIVKEGGVCLCGTYIFTMSENLRKHLLRIFNEEEKEYYDKLRDKAAVAVFPTFAGSYNLHDSKAAADKAVEYAKALVSRLIEEDEGCEEKK